MAIPSDYYEAPIRAEEAYIAMIQKLHELEQISLRFRYVFGGPMWWRGYFILLYKDESDTILPDDHNSLVDFSKKLVELLDILVGEY